MAIRSKCGWSFVNAADEVFYASDKWRIDADLDLAIAHVFTHRLFGVDTRFRSAQIRNIP